MLARISRELAQQIVDTVKSVCGQDINFIGSSGIVIASTDEERIGTYHEIGYQVARTKTVMEIESSDGFQGTKPGINLPVIHDRTLLAVIGISGSPNAVRKYADLAVRITSLLIREVELREFSRTQSEKQHFIIETLIHHPEQHDL